LAMRVWDEGDADANLGIIDDLLRTLQGDGGSGQRFADDAATLLLIATSHFEPKEDGYGVLLERVRALNAEHRLHVAIGHAGALGAHLRFGFEATYARDHLAARADNVADYPWLHFSLATLMRTYDEMPCGERVAARGQRVTEAILNGLTADTAGVLAAV